MKKGKISTVLGWGFSIFCFMLCLGMPFCFGTFLMFFAGILALPIRPLQEMWETILSKLPLPKVMKKLKPVVAVLLFILATSIGLSADNKADNGEKQASLPAPTATVEAAVAQKPLPTATAMKAAARATEEVDAQTAAAKTETPAPTDTPAPEKSNAASTVKATTNPTEKATPKATAAPTEKATPKATAAPTEKATPKATAKPTEKATPKPTEKATEEPTEKPTDAPQEPMVWVSKTGSRYHSNPECSGMKNPRKMSLSEAKSKGYTPCQNCY